MSASIANEKQTENQDFIEIEVEASLEEVPNQSKEEIIASINIAEVREKLLEDLEEFDDDLLALAADFYIPGLPNKNDDMVSVMDGVLYSKTTLNKFLDLMHDRKKVVGFISGYFFRDLNTGEIISKEDVLASDAPFIVSIKGYLWKKILGDKMSEFIIKAGDQSSSEFGKISLSFEYFFNGGFKILKEKDGKYEEVPDELFAEYKPYLKKYKGSGKYKDGTRIFRLVQGEQGVSGGGLVVKPAANVRGIVIETSETIKDREDQEDDDNDDDDNDDKETDASLKKEDGLISAFSSNSPMQPTSQKGDVRVNNFKFSNMSKYKTIEDIKANWEELSKTPEEAFASVAAFIASEIQKHSNLFEKQVAEKEAAKASLENEKNAIAASLAESKAQLEENTKELEALKAQLGEIKAAQEAAQKDELFNNRMSEFDSIFVLDKDDRKAIAEDLSKIESEESYAAYKNKMSSLMKEKTKAYVNEKKEKMKKALENKNIKASVESDDISEIIASLEITTPSLGVTPSINPTKSALRREMQEAFAEGVQVNLPTKN